MLPSLSFIYLIEKGITSLPPFAIIAYALVSSNGLTSIAPKAIEKSLCILLLASSSLKLSNLP
jgi:hypothetical protein